jgi:hypothetical protein
MGRRKTFQCGKDDVRPPRNNQGCQMVCFITKPADIWASLEGLGMENVNVDIFYDHFWGVTCDISIVLLYFVVLVLNFPQLGLLCQEKSGNPGNNVGRNLSREFEYEITISASAFHATRGRLKFAKLLFRRNFFGLSTSVTGQLQLRRMYVDEISSLCKKKSSKSKPGKQQVRFGKKETVSAVLSFLREKSV